MIALEEWEDSWGLFACRKLSMVSEEFEFVSDRQDGSVWMKVDYIEAKPTGGEVWEQRSVKKSRFLRPERDCGTRQR